jgi:hypothetical protein
VGGRILPRMGARGRGQTNYTNTFIYTIIAWKLLSRQIVNGGPEFVEIMIMTQGAGHLDERTR